MASLFGYEVETPEEILAQRNAEYEALKARDPSNPQLAMSQAIFNLVGSPELSKARATKNALAQAMQTFKAPEGADEYDMQIAQAEHIRNSMANVDPNLSLQANERILALRAERMEQDRLKTSGKMNDLKYEEAADIVEQGRRRVLFRVNPETGATVPVKSLPADISDEEAIAILQEHQAKDTTGTYQLGKGTDLWQISNMYKPAALRGSGLNVRTGEIEGEDSGLTSPELRTMRTALTNGRQSLNTFGSLLDVLDRDILALDKFSKDRAQTAEGIYNTLERIQTEFTGEYGAEQTAANEGTFGTAFEANRGAFEQGIRRVGVDSGVASAMVKSVAYQLAKTLDPGGRLSNQDVEMAIEMVAGNGSPQVILDLLEERMRQIDDSLREAQFAAEEGHLKGVGAKSAEWYYEARQGLEQKLLRFSEQIQQRKLDYQSQQKAGGTPNPAQESYEERRKRLLGR